MKIKSLTAGLILISACAVAQIAPPAQTPQTPGGNTSTANNDNGSYKPSSGDMTFELNFNPLSATPLSLNYLRARYFLSDDIALRTGVSIAMKGSSDNKLFEYALLPGIEKHFTGTNRLSPYVGGELAIAGRSSSSSVTTGTGTATTTETIKGAWNDGSNRGFFNFGVNGVIGCDFYFSRHIYMGLEAGFGFSMVKASDITVTIAPNGGTTTTSTTDGGSTFQLGPNYNSAIRIGFVF